MYKKCKKYKYLATKYENLIKNHPLEKLFKKVVGPGVQDLDPKSHFCNCGHGGRLLQGRGRPA